MSPRLSHLTVIGVELTCLLLFFLQASQSPANLVLAGRTQSKVQECIDALKAKYPGVNYHFLKIDLSVQDAVRKAAADFLALDAVPHLDILINSAGVMQIPERTLSAEGIEMHFATNHIGHFLFTNLIMSKILKAAEKNPTKGATRIINLTSRSPTTSKIRWDDLTFEKVNETLPEEDQPNYNLQKAWGVESPEKKSYLPVEAYGQSKVGNLLFAVGLNMRLFSKYGILAIACNPGTMHTELQRHLSPETSTAIQGMIEKGFITMKTLGAGAATSVTAALDPKLTVPETNEKSENHGVYMNDCQITDVARKEAVSSAEAERLWTLSESLTKEQFLHQ